MSDISVIKENLRILGETQNFAVLATTHDGQPHTSIVAFTLSEGLRRILFATTRATRKFRNIRANPSVAMLFDNRTNESKDLHTAIAVTAYGTAMELPEGSTASAEGEDRRTRHGAKHPYLAEFLQSPSSALVAIEVERYSMVSRFQHVIDWEIER